MLTRPCTLVLLLAGCTGTVGEPGQSIGDPPDPGVCRPSPGYVPAHRLNRAEYDNSVRDLFGTPFAATESLPVDPRSSSFDNNAGLLSMSDLLVESYFDVAERVVTDALSNRRADLVTCDPATGDVCGAEIVGRIAERAFRRPLEPGELEGLMSFFEVARSEGEGFDAGLSLALQAVLLSPHFLYRIVGVDAAGPVHRLDDFELASRMSYFLWSSTPDVRLMDVARRGELSDATVRYAEFQRMLADPRAAALVDRFATQWLALGKLDASEPDPAVYPEFDDAMRDSMRNETLSFMRNLFDIDASALDVIRADYTFVDERLADLYGVSVTGTERVDLTGLPRSGILTHPGILMMGSKADRTSPIKRGFWVLATILCGEPPPPPDDVVTEVVDVPGESLRAELERHRADPACNTCHQMMDPIGFGFERYDVLGRWRDTDEDGLAIDDRGELPDGTTFVGATELADVLLASGEFEACVTEKLMSYGLGREMSAGDACTVDEIASEYVGPEHGITELLWAVIQSEAFRTQEIR